MTDSSLKILRRYRYDPLDRLMDVGLLAGDSTQRFYQENHLTTELEQQMQRTILRHEAQPLAQLQNKAGVTESRLLVTDQAYSLLQTLSGINSRKLAYTAYGHHPSGSGLNHLPGFNGEYRDAITGHYPLGQGNRFFNPALMRFNSPDEMSPFGDGGINSYAYCENDPINFFDPTGNIKVAKALSKTKKILLKKQSTAITTTSTTLTRANVTSEKLSLVQPISSASNIAPHTSTPISTPRPFPYKLKSSQFAKAYPKEQAQHTKYIVTLKNNEIEFDKLIKSSSFQATSDATMQPHWDDLASKLKSSPNTNRRTILKRQLAKLTLQVKNYSIENHPIETINGLIRS